MVVRVWWRILQVVERRVVTGRAWADMMDRENESLRDRLVVSYQDWKGYM